MPGHPGFVFTFLYPSTLEDDILYLAAFIPATARFPTIPEQVPRLLRAIVSAFKSHLVEKKKKERNIPLN